MRVTVLNAANMPILTSIAKLGNFSEIETERIKYRNEIARLVPGSTPQLTGEITLGAAGYAGIFYGVVGTEVTDLFKKLELDPNGAAAVPEQ